MRTSRSLSVEGTQAAGLCRLLEKTGRRLAIVRVDGVGEISDDALHLAQSTRERAGVVERDAAP